MDKVPSKKEITDLATKVIEFPKNFVGYDDIISNGIGSNPESKIEALNTALTYVTGCRVFFDDIYKVCLAYDKAIKSSIGEEFHETSEDVIKSGVYISNPSDASMKSFDLVSRIKDIKNDLCYFIGHDNAIKGADSDDPDFQSLAMTLIIINVLGKRRFSYTMEQSLERIKKYYMGKLDPLE